MLAQPKSTDFWQPLRRRGRAHLYATGPRVVPRSPKEEVGASSRVLRGRTPACANPVTACPSSIHAHDGSAHQVASCVPDFTPTVSHGGKLDRRPDDTFGELVHGRRDGALELDLIGLEAPRRPMVEKARRHPPRGRPKMPRSSRAREAVCGGREPHSSGRAKILKAQILKHLT